MRTVSAIAITCAAALAAPGVASAAPQSSFSVRSLLTPSTEVRGDVRFTTPAGWVRTAGGGRHSYVRYRVSAGACTVDIDVSVRGKATKRSARQQVPGAAATTFGYGSRPGGAWGTLGPTYPGGEGESAVDGLYGTASVRVTGNRYGQIRIFARLRGCAPDSADAQALTDPSGRIVAQVNHVLARAKTSFRQQRVNRA